MLRSPSSLRSLLHLSGRLLRPPSPRLPSSPLSTRPRFLSSASPTPGGAQRATYDCDRLINSLCASASDTPVGSDIWAIFDPVAGRIVIQRPPTPPSTTEEEEEEVKGEGAGDLEDKEEAGVKLKGKGRWKEWASASRDKDQTGRPSVAAARKSARKGKGGKRRYMCSNCGELYTQWWGNCRFCKASGTFQKYRDMVLQGDGDPSEVEEGKGAGECEDEEKSGMKGNERVEGKGKRKRKREGQGNASGEKSQTSRPLDVVARKSSGNGGKERVSYMCSYCGEGHRRWWGYCWHCKFTGTLHRSRETAEPSGGELGDR